MNSYHESLCFVLSCHIHWSNVFTWSKINQGVSFQIKIIRITGKRCGNSDVSSALICKTAHFITVEKWLTSHDYCQSGLAFLPHRWSAVTEFPARPLPELWHVYTRSPEAGYSQTFLWSSVNIFLHYAWDLQLLFPTTEQHMSHVRVSLMSVNDHVTCRLTT